MRRGHFNVTNEIMADRNWPLIEIELASVFKLEAKEQRGFGAVEFHCTSNLFDETIECASPKYTAIFKSVNDKPKFIKFVKE